MITYYNRPDFNRGNVYEYLALYFVGVSLNSMPLMMIVFTRILYGIPNDKP